MKIYTFKVYKLKVKTTREGNFFFLTIFPIVISMFLFIKTNSYSTSSKSFPATLAETVQNQLKDIEGSYAVVVKNLGTGENYSFNEHQSYYSASLYKLWVMAAIFQEVQKGNLQEDADLDETLSQMITASDNYAAQLLVDKIGLDNLASFSKSSGFLESTIGGDSDTPDTTASDVELFFEKLYKGKLASKKYTQKMLDLLKKQTINNKLPKELPDSVIVAHKTGDLENVSNDAGIIYTTKGNYILVIMSSTPDINSSQKRIADISKAVYDYFTKK